jgi:hypothetical protein
VVSGRARRRVGDGLIMRDLPVGVEVVAHSCNTAIV